MINVRNLVVCHERQNNSCNSVLSIFLYLIICTILLGLNSNSYAKVWMANCTDGKNIQYHQDEKGIGHFYMKVLDHDQNFHLYQIATLQKSFQNSSAICGSVRGNTSVVTEKDSQKILQLCMNKEREIIYIKYKKEDSSIKSFASGEFCHAQIMVKN